MPTDPKKWLVCHPGAAWSVHDVFVALIEAMRGSGLGIAEFRLDGRMVFAKNYLHCLWRQMKKQHPEKHWPKPTEHDVVGQASWGLVERALSRQCDAILVVTAMFLNPDMLTLARRAGLGVYLLCTESPYDFDHEHRLSKLADGVWTNERTSVEKLATACPNVAYLPHGWRPGVHDQPQPSDFGLRSHDVVFVGTYFPERIKLLESVDWTGIDLGLYGHTEMIPDTSPIHQYVVGRITPNAIAAGLYRRARIGLNLYRQTPHGLTPAESLNPRAYELAAAGACVVSEYRPEVAEIFGSSVPTFRTAEELGGIVRRLLADDAYRAVISAQARAAIAPHMWTSRVEQMRRDLNRWALARPTHDSTLMAAGA